MNRLRALAVLLGAVALTSCDENAVQVIAGPEAGARVKFFHFGVGAPQVNFYANTTKMTAISSTTGAESTIGVAFGAAGSGGFYGSIEPGAYTLTGKISATVDKDLTIASVATTLADGEAYSFYMSGIYNTVAKTVDAFVVPDPIPADFDYSSAYVRFVHAISNANPMTLYALNTVSLVEVPIGAEVAYRGAGAFTAVPNGVYNLGTRYAGVLTNAISRTAVSFLAGRMYTITSRGDITVVSTTAATRPHLDNTANR
jgi:hypothetical protein